MAYRQFGRELTFRETELMMEAIQHKLSVRGNRGVRELEGAIENRKKRMLSPNEMFRAQIIEHIAKKLGQTNVTTKSLADHMVWFVHLAGKDDEHKSYNQLVLEGEGCLKTNWRELVRRAEDTEEFEETEEIEETEETEKSSTRSSPGDSENTSVLSYRHVASAAPARCMTVEYPVGVSARSSVTCSPISLKRHTRMRTEEYSESEPSPKRARKSIRSRDSTVPRLNPTYIIEDTPEEEYRDTTEQSDTPDENNGALQALEDIERASCRHHDQHVPTNRQIEVEIYRLRKLICDISHTYCHGTARRPKRRSYRNKTDTEDMKLALKLVQVPVSPDADLDKVENWVDNFHHLYKNSRLAGLRCLIGSYIGDEILEKPLPLLVLDPPLKFCAKMVRDRGTANAADRILDILSSVLLDAQFEKFMEPDYQENVVAIELERHSERLVQLTTLLFPREIPLEGWKGKVLSVCKKAMQLSFDLRQRPGQLSFLHVDREASYDHTSMQADGYSESEDLSGYTVLFPMLPGVELSPLGAEESIELSKPWVIVTQQKLPIRGEGVYLDLRKSESCQEVEVKRERS